MMCGNVSDRVVSKLIATAVNQESRRFEKGGLSEDAVRRSGYRGSDLKGV